MHRAIMLCLTLAACMPQTATDPGALSRAERAACLADGGTPLQGRAAETCARPTPDAGKSCTSGSQCTAGLCLTGDAPQPGGRCAPLDTNFGCLDVLEDGKQVTICID